MDTGASSTATVSAAHPQSGPAELCDQTGNVQWDVIDTAGHNRKQRTGTAYCLSAQSGAKVTSRSECVNWEELRGCVSVLGQFISIHLVLTVDQFALLAACQGLTSLT